MMYIAATAGNSPDTLSSAISSNSEFISTGGIQPVYFLSAVLFIIFIMIALLLIRISNMKSQDESVKKIEEGVNGK